MHKELLIKMDHNESAYALLEDSVLVEVQFERNSCRRLAGNIYKGRVENVLPGMQAAFINIGLDKNSFLYVDDIPAPDSDLPHNIDSLVKRGQEILVQISKEPMGSKGARVTAQPSLPGRYLVLMPKQSHLAISRRIEEDAERGRLRQLLQGLLPPGMGAIIRTVAQGVEQKELAADLHLLLKQWKRILNKAAKTPGPCLIHRDIDLLQRLIRDTRAGDIDRILTDTPETLAKMQEMTEDLAPDLKAKLVMANTDDLFRHYQIEEQIDKALRRKIWLKSGGYIIIDQIEALTVIDVNTGKYVGSKDLGETMLTTNLEAVGEISRQLRLRNIGGIIIVDFIDMDDPVSRRQLLSALEEELKKDRTRVTLLGMTQLGLIEMTRKKTGQGLSLAREKECPYCKGRGRVLSEETMPDNEETVLNNKE
ncbi:MAG: Rne/Rng family ribonuclease [Clostridiales bacterium]|nr:Rne/Rng family ribonuclease [Clostridiales bacterium]